MDKNHLKQQLDFELALALGYSQRKRTKRIAFNITQQLHDNLVEKYHLNGCFKISKDLEKSLLLMVSYTYPDALKVDIQNKFRVIKARHVELEGPHTSSPQLVVKYLRQESK